MWNVLIADDEPKIRQGLRETMEGFGLPVSVCAEARNSADALEKIKEFHPDIILLDICMPKLSGIQLLEEIRKTEQECQVIIISGFNEFGYAKQAIRLGVSEYLLKPIVEEELKNAVLAVIKELEKTRKSKKFMDLVKQQLAQNQTYLQDVFLNDWIEGKLSPNEWKEQAELLHLGMPDRITLVMTVVQPGYERKLAGGTVSDELYKMTLEKIMSEHLREFHPVAVFMSRYQDVIGIFQDIPSGIEEFLEQMQVQIEMQTGGKCCVFTESCSGSELPDACVRMRSQARKFMECKPIVLEARKYIYDHYGERELDLGQVAHAIGCSASYLSRMMKQEIGISFKEFLTRLRISQAIALMENRELSINEIAGQVGYSNQHYFSAAFKNCQGVSPSEFRKNLVCKGEKE